MSYFGHAFHKYFVCSGDVATSGSSADLVAGQLALVSAKDFKAIKAADAKKSVHKEVVVAVGSHHDTDSLTQFLGGMKESHKSRKINGNYISKFYLSKPKRAQNHVIAIGYNGVSECQPIAGTCDTTYTLRVEVKNSPALRAFNRNLYRDIQVHTPCCSVEGEAADPMWIADEMVKQINTDMELKHFVRAEKIFTPLKPFDSTVVLYNIYQLSLTDGGAASDLAAVQKQYAGYKVARVGRNANVSLSTYEMARASGAGAPAAFANQDIKVIPQCETCPAGYTLTDRLYKFILRRPETATANGNSITDYDATTSVYVSHESGVSTYILYRETPLPSDEALAVQGDVLINTGEIVDSVCTLDVVSTVAWTKTDEAYKNTRTLCITVSKDCGETVIPTTTTSTTTTTSSTTSTTTISPNSVLGRLQAFYSDNSEVVSGSIALKTEGNCADVYEIKQYSSNLLQDGCDFKAEAVYNVLQPFEGHVWEECPCLDASEDETAYKVGIKLTAAFQETKFGNCSFQPSDFFEVEPVKILASLVDREGNICNPDKWAFTELQEGKQASGGGEGLLRDYLISMGYKGTEDRWDSDARFREVKNIVADKVVDRDKFYKIYTLIHHIPSFDQSRLRVNQEVYALHFAFPEDADTAAFEKVIGGYAGSNDVFLESY
jgi:hypothetical protein